MLEGINANDIIVGAYVDRKGGVCPMLAAHRCGGRTDFLAFAHAWDRFTHAKRARRATEREIAVPPGIRVHWLKLVGLDRTIPHRGIAVLADANAMLAIAKVDKRVKVFKPITKKIRQTKAVM